VILFTSWNINGLALWVSIMPCSILFILVLDNFIFTYLKPNYSKNFSLHCKSLCGKLFIEHWKWWRFPKKCNMCLHFLCCNVPFITYLNVQILGIANHRQIKRGWNDRGICLGLYFMFLITIMVRSHGVAFNHIVPKVYLKSLGM